MRGIWITWEKQRRNKGISSALGFDLCEIISTKNRLLRYIECLLESYKTIIRSETEIIAVQNPSIVLALFAILLRNFNNYYLIIDSHNAGIFPLEGRIYFLNRIAAFIQKKANLTLVTNRELKNIVMQNKGNPFVLPDKIPDYRKIGNFRFEKGRRIVFICTFNEDEPYKEVFKAAANLPEDIIIYVTGNYQNKVNREIIPGNIRLLGYITDSKFWALLAGAEIVIDLTTREHCLVCGAYEGISLNKPLILSDTQATKEFFSKGCVYVKSNAEDIKMGVLNSIERLNSLTEEIRFLKETMEIDWFDKIGRLKKIIADSNKK